MVTDQQLQDLYSALSTKVAIAKELNPLLNIRAGDPVFEEIDKIDIGLVMEIIRELMDVRDPGTPPDQDWGHVFPCQGHGQTCQFRPLTIVRFCNSRRGGSVMFGWYTRNSQGFWCNVCGDVLKPDFHFDTGEEWDEFDNELEDGGGCRSCGAPDEIDPESI